MKYFWNYQCYKGINNPCHFIPRLSNVSLFFKLYLRIYTSNYKNQILESPQAVARASRTLSRQIMSFTQAMIFLVILYVSKSRSHPQSIHEKRDHLQYQLFLWPELVVSDCEGNRSYADFRGADID